MFYGFWNIFAKKTHSPREPKEYRDDDGKVGLPSWVDNDDTARKFAAGVQILASDRLSSSALTAMFSLEKPLDQALAIAGAVERQGGSFSDQQFAVMNFMVKLWGGLSADLQESISEGFRYR